MRFKSSFCWKLAVAKFEASFAKKCIFREICAKKYILLLNAVFFTSLCWKLAFV